MLVIFFSFQNIHSFRTISIDCQGFFLSPFYICDSRKSSLPLWRFPVIPQSLHFHIRIRYVFLNFTVFSLFWSTLCIAIFISIYCTKFIPVIILKLSSCLRVTSVLVLGLREPVLCRNSENTERYPRLPEGLRKKELQPRY